MDRKETADEFEARHGHPRWVAFLGCLACTADAYGSRKEEDR